jgi:hypothetical protein
VGPEFNSVLIQESIGPERITKTVPVNLQLIEAMLLKHEAKRWAS